MSGSCDPANRPINVHLILFDHSFGLAGEVVMSRKIFILLSVFAAAFLLVACSLSEDSSRGSPLEGAVDPCGDDPRIMDILESQEFVREKGKPFTEEREFSAPFPGDFCLVVVNGDHGPPQGKRISSAVISIDGEHVIGPDLFNQNVGLVTESVHLEQGQHVLGVQLRSKPGSKLTVAIRGIPDDLEPPVVVITSPPNNTSTREDSITVLGVATDNVALEYAFVTVNGDHYPVEVQDTGIFSVDVGLETDDGESMPSFVNEIEVTAVDPSGNSGSASVDVEHVKPVVPGQVIVLFAPGTAKARIDEINDEIGATIHAPGYNPDKYLMALPPGMSLEDGILHFLSKSEVIRATPNPVFKLGVLPSDTFIQPDQGKQDGLLQVGFPDAWEIVTGSDTTIIAILDSGIDYGHPDVGGLNLWSNPGEEAGNDRCEYNGIDDDGDGLTDACYGWDFCSTPDCSGVGHREPDDLNGHGTLIAGLIGAKTDNNYGIAGTNSEIQMMILKVTVGSSRNVTGFAASNALDFAVRNAARLSLHAYAKPLEEWNGVNDINQNGVPDDIEDMLFSFSAAEDEDHLAFVMAGNGLDAIELTYPSCLEELPWIISWVCIVIRHVLDQLFLDSFGMDNDVAPQFPGSFPQEFPDYFEDDLIVTVAATNRDRKIAAFSNYGLNSVDIAAPGTADLITSTLPKNPVQWDADGRERICDPIDCPNKRYFAHFGGTSAAAAHAAGLAALIIDVNGELTAAQVRDVIFRTSSPVLEKTLWETLEQDGIDQHLHDAICDPVEGKTCWDMSPEAVMFLRDWLSSMPFMSVDRPIANGEIDAHAAVLLAQASIVGWQPLEPVVSDDGTTMAFISSGISEENLLGGQSLTLLRIDDPLCRTQFPTNFGYTVHTGPSVNEDGTKVVYTEHLPGFGGPPHSVVRIATFEYDPATCFTKTSDGLITPHQSGIYNIEPSISPEGDWVAFASDRDGDFDIFVARADGSAPPAKVSQDPYSPYPEQSKVDRNPSICRDGDAITWLGSYVGGGIIDPVTVVEKVQYNGVSYTDPEVVSPQSLTKSGPALSSDCSHLAYAGSLVIGGVIVSGATWPFEYDLVSGALTTLLMEPTYVSAISGNGQFVPMLVGMQGATWSLAVARKFPSYSFNELIPENPNDIGVYPACDDQVEQNEYPYSFDVFFPTPLPLCEHAINGAGTKVYFIGRDSETAASNIVYNIYEVPTDWDPDDPARADELQKLTRNK